ncbi:MAG: FAD-dependent oxidoreductase [Bacteroidia bacterium]
MNNKRPIEIVKDFYACKIHSIKTIYCKYLQIFFYSKSPIWNEYLPGQYVYLNLNNKIKKYWIASHHFGGDLPSIILHKNEISFLKNGDELLLSKPEGTFTLNPISNYKRTFIFLAQDEGVIPIYVMLKSLLYIENMSKSSIYTICKDSNGILFDEIDFLKNMVHGRIKYEQEINKKTFSTTKLNELFEFACKDKAPIFYVCGGKAFINKVADFMLKKKVPINNMEYFKLPLN